MAATMDSLADELVNVIVQNILDVSALRSCCLVSRQFRAIAQPLLFSKCPTFPRESNRKLYKTLFQHRYLQSYVKTIWVHTKLWFEEPVYETLFREIGPKLKTLFIANQFTPEIPLPIYDALVSCLSSNQLTAMFLYRVNGFPITIFYNLPYLRELHLCASVCIGFSSENGNPDIVPTSTPTGLSKPKLEKLYIEDVTARDQISIVQWFRNPQCAFDLSNLKVFHGLKSTTEDSEVGSYRTFYDFVNLVSSSLEDLALDPSPAARRFKLHSFNPLPNLRSLNLSLQNEFFPFMNFIPWVVNVLKNLSHPTKLEYVDLPCIFTGGLLDGVDPNMGWLQLDELLVSESFPNLKEVTFVAVRILSEEENGLGNIVNQLPRLFPQLLEKGLLTVEDSDVIGYVSRRDCWYKFD